MPVESRRRRKPSEPPKPAGCRVCGQPVLMPEAEFCAVHFGLAATAEFVGGFFDKAQQALRRGKTGAALTNLAAGLLVEAGAPALRNAVPAILAGAAMRAAQQKRPAPPPPKRGLTPQEAFKVLGLNQDDASTDDVRRVQRELANIWHPDKGGPVAKEKMAEVNAAVEVCLAWLGKKPG